MDIYLFYALDYNAELYFVTRIILVLASGTSFRLVASVFKVLQVILTAAMVCVHA